MEATTYTIQSGGTTRNAIKFLDPEAIMDSQYGGSITFTVTGDITQALGKAKADHLRTYLNNGGNPRNKRSIAADWTAIAKAIAKAG